MRMCMKQVVLGAVLSLSAVSLSAGCSKKAEEIQIAKETATPVQTEAPTPTATKAAQTATPTQIVTAAPEDQPQDLVATQDIPQEIARTGETITLYNVDTNAQTIIYGLSNGEWVDDLGVGHQAEGAGQWSDANGNMYAAGQ